MIKSVITEYGVKWLFYRFLYLLKIKMLNYLPITEKIFEKDISINRIDIFKTQVQSIEKFLCKLPTKDKREIIQIADDAINGKIKAFSSLELDYGNPIKWNFNPITGIEVDKFKKWYKIDDFDSVRGDIKAIWEVSRFTHFFYFARAYMLTKNHKYYDAFSTQIENWIYENKYSYGPNYKCGQEAALRMINVLIVYGVFRDYGIVKKIDVVNVKRIVKDSYKKILSNFFYAHKCIKNNHTLSEITGLMIGAWCSEKDKSLRTAYRLMDKEVKNQFMDDGGYVQYSFNYQRFALQVMEFVLKISESTGYNLSSKSTELIEKSALQMYHLQDVEGKMPNYGNNDGALIFPLTACDYRDYTPILNSVYALLKEDRLYSPGMYDEEFLWFSKADTQNIDLKRIDRKSKKYGNSGFYCLRKKKGFLMVVLQKFKTRPAQMDQMHIDLWHRGVNILCDSGSYSYASMEGEKMALTAAHNTVKVYGKEQMNKYGPFLTYGWTDSKIIKFTDTYFEGIMTSKNNYSHRRIISISDKNCMVEDHVSCNGAKYKMLLHTMCEVKVHSYGVGLYHKDKLFAKIKLEEDFRIEEDYISLYYLKKTKIKKIVIYPKSEICRIYINLIED